MSDPKGVNLTQLRRGIKKDIYENIDCSKQKHMQKCTNTNQNDSSTDSHQNALHQNDFHQNDCSQNDSRLNESHQNDCKKIDIHHHGNNHHEHKICKAVCKTICDKLNLTPPEDACEKTNVTHHFQVTLGECKVIRDKHITHQIKANLEHHIKENILCKHDSCTKQTCEEIDRVDNGKCCKVDFPNCDDEIVFVDDWGHHPDNLSKSKSKSRSKSKSKSESSSIFWHKTQKKRHKKHKHHHKKHTCHKRHKCHKHKDHCETTPVSV